MTKRSETIEFKMYAQWKNVVWHAFLDTNPKDFIIFGAKNENIIFPFAIEAHAFETFFLVVWIV